jgi:hypothetical protein
MIFLLIPAGVYDGKDPRLTRSLSRHVASFVSASPPRERYFVATRGINRRQSLNVAAEICCNAARSLESCAEGK